MVAYLISMLLLAAAPEPAAASPTAAPAAQPAAAPKAKPPKMTCWDEEPTGSHITKHVCMTPEELELARRQGQELMTPENRGEKMPMLRK